MFRHSTPQGSLWDSEFQMSDRKRGRLEKTWARIFRVKCLPLIDEEIFRPLYCDDNGAPCKSVRLVVAAAILRDVFDLTWAETQERVDFDLRWHLALGIDPCADDEYVSERTLRYFEAKLLTHDLVSALFADLTDKLLARLGITTREQRLDTTQMLSNFARCSRLGVFCETHRVLLRALAREAAPVLATLPVSICRRYLREDGHDSSYDDARASDSRRRLGVAARDAYRLREALHGVALPDKAAEAYALLERLVNEHCTLVDTPQPGAEGDGDADLAPVPVVVKEAKTLTGAVLQTPHDPDVTYSGHKGQGYEALITETCAAENAVQLITHVRLERACGSDADRVVPTLDALEARGLTPETLLADTAFGSAANYQACAVRGVELIAPTPGAEASAALGADAGGAGGMACAAAAEEGFTVQVCPGDLPSCCPAGIQAESTTLRVSPTAGLVAVLLLPEGACVGCARRARCPLTVRADGRLLALLEVEELLREDRRTYEQSADFRDAYRARAGIEGTNSELKRSHGLAKLRVRGAARVAAELVLRALACNLKRALAYWGKCRRNASNSTPVNDIAREIGRWMAVLARRCGSPACFAAIRP